jgi:dTDP-4-amino-4,6-dideoxy-D-galactose acyltransferase
VREGALTEHHVIEALGWCAANRIDCLYLLTDGGNPDTVAAAERHGFHLMDVRITLDRRVDAHGPVNSAGVRRATADDVEALRAIASTAHTDSRFYVDPHFPRERCDALYAAWIEQSCRDQSDATFVATQEDRLVGYVTVKIEGATGQIGLMAVASDARGQGTGRALVDAALSSMAAQGAQIARVVTQGRNIAAQRLYQACGFTTSRVDLWYHRWFTTPESSAP